MSARRLWWYEVDEAWGYERREHPAPIGSVLRDRWKADRTWQVMNTRTFEHVGGWHARLLGEATGEWADKPNPEWLTDEAKRIALAPDDPARPA